MKSSLRTKLMVGFLSVIVISGIVTVWVGVHMIGDEVIRRAQEKVHLDLNSAREIYNQRLESISEVLRLTAVRFFLKESLLAGKPGATEAELLRILESENLDVLTMTDRNGTVIFRARNPGLRGDSQAGDQIVATVIETNQMVAGTQIVPAAELTREGLDLAEQAHIEILHTPMARPRSDDVETSGMMLKAAAPILGYGGELAGILYGGKLLNRNYEIVDAVKGIIYRGSTYKGKDTGTVTIFQGDLRISTNVPDSGGGRAIGTRVSEEVYNQVIAKGVPWIGRAFVVNDWYITAYEPLKNLNGDIIGMLYVGMLEAPYVDLRNRVALTFTAITAVTILLLSIVMYFATSNIIKPLKRLLHATEKVAKGYLAYRVKIATDDELGQLAKSFNTMTEELEKTTGDYHALTQTLEEKVRERTLQLKEAQDQLVQSEKLTSLGKMAAGIAHEINNPLTSILINSHLIAEDLGDQADLNENLKLIIDETSRCSEIVKGLLEFSKQTAPEKKPADINRLLDDTLFLLKSHVLPSGVEIVRDLAGNLPVMAVDANKMKQVFTNIILNALEAMPHGGTLTIRSQVSEDMRSVKIEFEDTGCGMSREVIAKIFDPFFSTKEAKGTGLGLSVSRGIVELHRGQIDVESEPGKGTTITIKLPVSQSEND